MKLRFLLSVLSISGIAFSQPKISNSENFEGNPPTEIKKTKKGIITGTLTEKGFNNQVVPFSTVSIKGTQISTTTDIDGKYVLSVAPGKYILQFTNVEYKTVEISVVVNENQPIVIDQALTSNNIALDDIVIYKKTSRQKESALLLDQKNAAGITQSIGAMELSRKGVSDVAAAVAKTSGIAKQEGSGNIFVRGLGDRYNSTTMNGLPIPSNEPEKKNINLEIFPTDILEYVSIDKVYNSTLYGDFSGGNVDIISKKNSGNAFLNIQAGSKINTNSLNEEAFKLQNGIGQSGFDNKTTPSNPLTEYNYNTLELGEKTPIGISGAISGGKSFNIGEEGKFNLFATANHSNEYNSKSEGTAKGSVNGAGVANKNFEKYTDMNYSTSTTAMSNLEYKVNSDHKLNFNSVFINTSNQSKEEYYGYMVDIANEGNGLVRRLNYEKNSLWINQLLGSHRLGKSSELNWGISYNTIEGSMPDRVQNIFRKESNGYVLSSISAPDNHRYFQNLKENELAATVSFDHKFNEVDGEYKGKLSVGLNSKMKNRDFQATQFNFKSIAPHNNTVVDPNNLDTFYNQQNFSSGYFTISTFRGNSQVTNATNPQTYTGEQNVSAAFANVEYKFQKLTTVLGLRGESLSQKVDWNTQLGGVGSDKLDKLAFLPSLAMKYELNQKQNLRFGFSKTYTLPQFKERALFVYEEVLQVKIGNPFLYESDDYNFDLKWEMFPQSEEVLSVSGFGKYIQNPINEVTISSSSNDISYINTGNYGYVAGAELEYRKLLFKTDAENSKKLSAGINASYLYSDQELNAEKIKNETDYQVDFTNAKSKFTGASDFLLNSDLSFLNEWNDKKNNLTTTLAYSYFSDRVYSIGTNGKGNLVDKGFGSFDLILKSKLSTKLGLDFSVKNILNPTINRVQENKTADVNVLSYKKGTMLSLGLNYKF